MVLKEAFRNYGSESFKRIEIKLCEVDSPSVTKLKNKNKHDSKLWYNMTEQQRTFSGDKALLEDK